MKKMGHLWLTVLAVLILFSGARMARAEVAENKFINELKNWEWSLGGMAYLFEAEDFYYAAGAKRDLGSFFEWLPAERLYGELGYLNSRMLGNAGGQAGIREYGYAGLSTNANFIAQSGINGINKLLNANFKLPEVLNNILATVGILGAKRLDNTFWDLEEGYDWGLSVAIIKGEW